MAALLAGLAACGRPTAKRAPIPPPPPPPVRPDPPVRPPDRTPAPDAPPKVTPVPRVVQPPVDQPGAPPPQAPPVDREALERFQAGRFRTAYGQTLQYRLFPPAELEPGRSYPLVVFLHGASGAGTGNWKQIDGSRLWGTALWTSPEIQARYPAFVLAPQADHRYAPTWVDKWRLPENPDPAKKEPLELILELIDELALALPVDLDRVYLTGYSMGGFGTWIGVSRHPDRFAAALAICGGGDPAHVVETNAAIWAFHGTADRSVPVRRSRSMVEALRRAGKEVRYTEYKGKGHDIWRWVYAEPGLADWLFSHRRQDRRGGEDVDVGDGR